MTHVLGIDFGASQAMSIVTTGSGPGTVVVTPSVIFAHPSGRILAGESAMEPACADPSRALVGVRACMLDDGFMRKIGTAELRPADLAPPLFVQIAADVRSTAEHIAACVVAVPAHSHSGFRQMVADAGRAAGLPIVQLVNEPTAAALCYAQMFDLRGRVLVCGLDHDLDACVLELFSADRSEVLSADGEMAKPSEAKGVSADLAGAAVKRALKQAKTAAESLAGVIVYGERAEEAAQAIGDTLGCEPLREIDPAEAVARGAAMTAARLLREGLAAAA